VVDVIADISEDVSFGCKSRDVVGYAWLVYLSWIYLLAVVTSGSDSVTMLSAIATSLSTFVTLCKPLADAVVALSST